MIPVGSILDVCISVGVVGYHTCSMNPTNGDSPTLPELGWQRSRNNAEVPERNGTSSLRTL